MSGGLPSQPAPFEYPAHTATASSGSYCGWCGGSVSTVSGVGSSTNPRDGLWRDFASCPCGRTYMRIEQRKGEWTP